MDESARRTALEVMGPRAHATDSFVFGEVDEADVPKLEDAGLIVQQQAPARLDTTNNVERVVIENPQSGNYVVLVVASNLLKAPQDFALVVAGDDVPALDSI
jgi:hypothetical protein